MRIWTERRNIRLCCVAAARGCPSRNTRRAQACFARTSGAYDEYRWVLSKRISLYWLMVVVVDAGSSNVNIGTPAIDYGTTFDPSSNPLELLEDMSFCDWGDAFWSDWLFPSGMEANASAPSYLPLGNLTSELVSSLPDQSVTPPPKSLHDTITSLFPIPHTCPYKSPWPFGNADDGEPLLSMPRLGPSSRASEASYFHLPAMTDTTFDNILQAANIPMTHPPWRTFTLEEFPASSTLDECVDLYFANFNPVSSSLLRSPHKR